MNAVEIEEAISALAEQAFDPVEFPFAFRHRQRTPPSATACRTEFHAAPQK